MIKWWHQAQSLILSSNLNQSMLRSIVHESKLELKKGAKKFIIDLLRSNTPILFFSAGLGK